PAGQGLLLQRDGRDAGGARRPLRAQGARLAVGEGAAWLLPPLGQAHLLARDALDHPHQALRSASLLARAAPSSPGRLWRTRSRDLRGHQACSRADQHRGHPCAHGVAPLQPGRGGRAQDRGARPARHWQDRRRRLGRQPPAVGHGSARLPAPARDPHHRSFRELAPGSARAAEELDLSPPRQAHAPRPQDVCPAATLGAPPRRVPARAPLHRRPQGSAPRHLSRAAPRCKRAETEQAATVVLLSSPASSKAPGRRVARCSAPLLIINSGMSKQRSAGHRTVNIRPQALRAGSGVMVATWSPITPVVAEVTWPLRATLQTVNVSGSAATGAVMKSPPTRSWIPRAPTMLSVERTVK